MVRALNAAGASVSFVEIETDRGHDAFLLDEPELFATIRGFLSSAGRARGARLSMNAHRHAHRRAAPPASTFSPSPSWSRRARASSTSAAATARLLKLLEATRGVDGRGIEISQKGVNECVARGLSVIQGDADTDLVDYPDDAFDFVILSQTLQATHRPRDVRRADAADRPEGDRLVPEFRPLADPGAGRA